MSARTRSVAVAVSAMNGTSGKRSRKARELPVLGPEVVAPFADAMRLVDRDQVDVPALQLGEEAGEHQPLGRDVEEPEFAVAKAAQPRACLRPSSREEFRNVAGHAARLQCIDLVFHQRNQRRDHDRQAGLHERGKLEAERLPAPVGSRAKTSRPAIASAMISSCSGRKEVKPK